MTDRELLELAAKAAGLKVSPIRQEMRDARGFGHVGLWIHGVSTCWNPLFDDSDALRLAATLRIHIEWAFTQYGKPEEVQASPKGMGHCADIQPLGDDPCAVVRRAIVRAAAEIARAQAA